MFMILRGSKMIGLLQLTCPKIRHMTQETGDNRTGCVYLRLGFEKLRLRLGGGRRSIRRSKICDAGVYFCFARAGESCTCVEVLVRINSYGWLYP